MPYSGLRGRNRMFYAGLRMEIVLVYESLNSGSEVVGAPAFANISYARAATRRTDLLLLISP